ncbi:hypothetical protein [Oryza sativa Japonica Group]|uniref:Uncharacterized protein OJ1126_G08.23 n=1 Tax=Oryza sativa subsp. japonica TaxID=39947 RepID=Q5VNH7_ORYSJ|nr:hypothetical protein [Oryza sativa Japonica Group]
MPINIIRYLKTKLNTRKHSNRPASAAAARNVNRNSRNMDTYQIDGSSSSKDWRQHSPRSRAGVALDGDG